MKGFFDSDIGLVSRVLDMQLQRQNVTSSNLANIKTPGYKPMKLEFEAELQAALGLDSKEMLRNHPLHMPTAFNPEGFDADWKHAFKPRMIYGEDRVDLDKEMAVMAKTQLHYSALTSVIKSKFDGLKNIIMEGSK